MNVRIALGIALVLVATGTGAAQLPANPEPEPVLPSLFPPGVTPAGSLPVPEGASQPKPVGPGDAGLLPVPDTATQPPGYEPKALLPLGDTHGPRTPGVRRASPIVDDLSTAGKEAAATALRAEAPKPNLLPPLQPVAAVSPPESVAVDTLPPLIYTPTGAAVPVASPPPVMTASPILDVPPVTPVVPAGCQSCGTGLVGGPATDLMTADPSGCYPGRFGGDDANPSHALGRFLYGVYSCICVPDPCYEPKWTPLQDAAFFTPTARPVTQTRFRVPLTRGLSTPDRAEYFWARGIGDTRGPTSPDGRRVSRINDDMVAMYMEGATGRVGVYTEITYHRVRPDAGPGAAGFGDLTLGTKTLLHDCELFQITFQMQTTIPSANTEKGLGTGHLSLEPSVILGLKLSRDAYFQGQVAEWIPIAGDNDFAGAAIRYNFSLNHVLCRPLPSCPIIGTLEFQGITFQDGAFTDPATGAATKASGTSYLSFGPGIRSFICDRVDFGVGSAYGIGLAAGPRQQYRLDLRVRY